MGRNPWLTYSQQLVRERADWSRTKEGTAQERERKLRYLGKIVRGLHEGGRLTTRNPAGMGERDIMNLFGHLKERGLKPGTMLKYLGIMSQLCALAGNAIISQLRAHPVKAQWLPHGSGKAGKRSFRLETVMSFLDIAPKDLRTSYGQVLMDCGATIETTSRLLRHASVATTQRWYVDLRPDDSYDKLQALFAQPPQKSKGPKYMEMHP